ncbi:MAG TPA: VOC family protein [Actinotalea caeni]|uniref:VOC family protein n=1 Tax=Actinotalea caeni TaxID=1348467 RepID=UPI002B4AF4C1|nr:VOC family protein [Actinotalea caeni]HLV53992.1 VOC family protein [Actinotalea caeni]
MASLRDVVTDCEHPASLARFWAQVLDGYEVAPYDEDELARLREAGIDDVEDDPTVLVQPVGDAPGVRFWFQKVPERKVVKNRVHVDLTAADPPAEVARLRGLGASVVAEHEGLVVLADPEGNEFCLLR